MTYKIITNIYIAIYIGQLCLKLYPTYFFFCSRPVKIIVCMLFYLSLRIFGLWWMDSGVSMILSNIILHSIITAITCSFWLLFMYHLPNLLYKEIVLIGWISCRIWLLLLFGTLAEEFWLEFREFWLKFCEFWSELSFPLLPAKVWNSKKI